MPTKKNTQEIQKSKRLSRSEKDRMIAGVCGGIADYFGWDSTLIRLLFILVILLGGSGVLVYLVLWFVLPTESEKDDDFEQRVQTTAAEISEKAQSLPPTIKRSGQSMWGVALIGFGILLLLQNFGIGKYLQFDKTWPLILVVAGFMILGKK